MVDKMKSTKNILYKLLIETSWTKTKITIFIRELSHLCADITVLYFQRQIIQIAQKI